MDQWFGTDRTLQHISNLVCTRLSPKIGMQTNLKIFVSNKTKGPEQDSKIQWKSPMPVQKRGEENLSFNNNCIISEI